MMASKVLLWTVLCVRSCSGQLKHMRAHGHDGKHEHTKPVESSFVDFDSFPPGEAVSGPGKMVKSKEKFVMRAGYREFEGSRAPPWVVSDKGVSKDSALKFLNQAESACEQAKQALRAEYTDKFADTLFGSSSGKGGGGATEKGMQHVSSDPEAKLAARIASALLNQTPRRRRFTVAVTGQSNAAGHGSYFDETYTFAMGRAAASAFKAAGIDLAVQNFALGGGRTLPTTGWCGESQVGPSVDMAVWDFTMTEGGKSEVQGEAWVRSMLTLPNPPASLLFMETNRAKKWSGIYKSHVGILGLDNPSNGLPLMDNSTSLPELLRFLHPDCKEYSKKHGDEANVLCRKDKWTPALDLMKWSPNPKSGQLVPAVYDPVSGKKLGGGCPGMNPWHDGWKLHRLKGSVMGHMLLRCLSQAITLVKSKLEGVGPGSGSSDVASILGELRSTSLPQLSGLEKLLREGLPKPGKDCLATPYCPLVGSLGCQTGLHPAVKPHLLATDETGKEIELSLDGANNGKKSGEALCHQGHIDHKYSVLVEPQHGWVSVKLHGGLSGGSSDKSSGPAILICEPPTGWNRDPKIAELSNKHEVKFRLSTGSDGLGHHALPNPSAIEITKACYEFKGLSSELAKGEGRSDATLQVKALTSKAVRFDHVIWSTHNNNNRK